MKRNKWPYLFCAPFLLAYALFMVFPMCYSFFLSLYDYNGIVEKHFVGLTNYVTILTKDRLFWKALGNTVLIMGMSLPVNLLLGLIIAYLLFRLAKGRRLFQVVNFLPYITTPVAIGFIFSYIFDWHSGIFNSILVHIGILNENYYWLQHPWSSRIIVALMIVWRNLGYCVTIYLSGMTAISKEVYEAASIDGASKWRTLWSIVVPLLKNTLIFLFITSMIGGFQMFDEPVQLYSGWSAAARNIGGPDYSVLTMIWKFYDDSFGSNTRLGYGAAIAYILFVIIGACSLISFLVSSKKEKDA